MSSLGLGRLVDTVVNDPEFAQERAVFDLIQEIVTGLKAMRERAGLTQTEMAKAIGVSQGRISQIESGFLVHAPNVETIARYATVCGEHVKFAATGEGAAASPAAKFVPLTRGRKRSVLVGEAFPLLPSAKAHRAILNALIHSGLDEKTVSGKVQKSLREDVGTGGVAKTVTALAYGGRSKAMVLDANDHLYVRDDAVIKVAPFIGPATAAAKT